MPKIVAAKTINGVEYSIEQMQERDIDAVVLIEQSSATSPWSETQFRSELTNTFSQSFVITSEHGLTAFAVIWSAADEIQIANVAISPSSRRIGLATFLLKTILQSANEKGFNSAHLEVRRSNSNAISLYTKIGFKINGIRKNYYKSPKEDAYLMSAQLT